jgi:hypothetical protein
MNQTLKQPETPTEWAGAALLCLGVLCALSVAWTLGFSGFVEIFVAIMALFFGARMYFGSAKS